uniref:CRAL-TRIO domain-containing protein n=1 Tax=Panagrolaimus sp. PS1159 TaxID=55785 RepID=A0AC35FWM1_9BILA
MTGNGLNDRLLLLTTERKNILNEIILDVNKSINRAKVYEKDLDRLNNDYWWALAFFLAHKEDIHVTSAVIQECLRWRKCTNVYDLSGAKNIDLTFMKFMIHCFKYFYPGCLAEILLYGIPTRMHASVRVFQQLLANYEFPMAHEITEKHQIHAFIRDFELPETMNGT